MLPIPDEYRDLSKIHRIGFGPNEAETFFALIVYDLNYQDRECCAKLAKETTEDRYGLKDILWRNTINNLLWHSDRAKYLLGAIDTLEIALSNRAILEEIANMENDIEGYICKKLPRNFNAKEWRFYTDAEVEEMDRKANEAWEEYMRGE